MYIRKNTIALMIITVSFILGLCTIFINPNTIINIIMYLLAAILIFIAINFLIKSNEYLGKDKTILIIQSICLIIVSIIMIFIPNQIMRIIIGILFIIYPLFFTFTVNNKGKQFKKDIPKYIIGILLILSLDVILKIMMIIIGSILILFSVYLTIILIKNRHNVEQPNIILKLGMKWFLRKENIDKWEL